MRLFRKSRTKPLPEGAEIQTRKNGRIAVWTDGRGRKRTAGTITNSEGQIQIEIEIKTWFLRYRDHRGIRREISTGCRDRSAAEAKAREILNGVERIKAGIISPGEAETIAAGEAGLERHLGAFQDALESKGCSTIHIRKTMARLRTMAQAIQATTLQAFNVEACQRWMGQRTAEGMSAQTRNHYRVALTNFGNWAERMGVLAKNPFSKLAAANVRADRRHVRRALTIVEVERLLRVARYRPLAECGRATCTVAGKKRSNWKYVVLTWESLDGAVAHARMKLAPEQVRELEAQGRERELIYRVLLGTGLRKGELAQIRIGDVDLKAGCIHLSATAEKNRKGTDIPLRKDLQRSLQEWIASKQQAPCRADASGIRVTAVPAETLSAERLFTIPDALDKILTRDLAVAGIPKVDTRGRVVDVHALRTTFGTYLSAAGVPLRVAQAAMRHSDPKLTANIYTDPILLDIRGAVEALPAIGHGTDESKAAGTNDPMDSMCDPEQSSA